MLRDRIVRLYEDNEWEKLDYLTIIPIEPPLTLTITPYLYYDDPSDEEPMSLVIYISKDDGMSWDLYRSDWDPELEFFPKVHITTDCPIKIKCNLYSSSFGFETYMGDEMTFFSDKKFNLAGTPMSLLYGDNFKDKTEIPIRYCGFRYMFKDSLVVKILNPKTFLPATSLSGSYTYAEMFYNCVYLENAPELPATKLSWACYEGMFNGCTSLVKGPTILPSITLVGDCYRYMFSRCRLLETAPILPSTTLTSECYYYMFNGCNKLNYIKCDSLTPLNNSYSKNWVYAVSSTGVFVKNKDATWDNTFGVNAIPSGWTVITE